MFTFIKTKSVQKIYTDEEGKKKKSTRYKAKDTPNRKQEQQIEYRQQILVVFLTILSNLICGCFAFFGLQKGQMN